MLVAPWPAVPGQSLTAPLLEAKTLMPSSAGTPSTVGAAATRRRLPQPGKATGRPEAATPHTAASQAHQPGAVAQRGLFRGPAKVPAELYARIEAGTVRRGREQLALHEESAASTNTYFGRFPAAYWQRWTSVREVTARMRVEGTGTIALHASDHDGHQRTVQTVDVDGLESVQLRGELTKFTDGGSLWVTFRTAGGRLTVDELRWLVPAPQRVRRTWLVMPTCDRVEDCLTTLESLADDPDALGTLEGIYIADQGSTAVADNPRFAELAAKLEGYLTYLRQPNLGGAAGYTRGLYEIDGSGVEHGGVFFMDDDILLEPEIAVRLTAFADHTARPAIVGGQMLNLLHPNQLLCSAEYADLPRMTPGQPAAGTGMNQDLLAVDQHTGRPILQERRVDAGYNGWWACLIPAEIVAEMGYPLPVFFQGDDVEYGYRAHTHGFPTVTLPGAGVWHADFHWKDWDHWSRFFHLRNWLIIAALHTEFDPTIVVPELAKRFGQYLLSMQYGLAAMLLKAVRDFMAGPGILEDGGAAALTEVRALRAEYPETVTRDPATDELVPADMPVVPSAPEPRLWRLVTMKRVLHQLAGRSKHPVGEVPAKSNAWWHVALFETAVVTDMSQEGVRVRKRDKRLALSIARDGARVLHELARRAPELREQYRAAMPRLVSRENWRRLYDL